MGTFVISQRLNESYKFEFVSRKGKTIFVSRDFELRFECEEFIEFFKENLEKSEFLKYKTSKGKYYYKIYLDHHEIVTSRKFSTELLMNKSINEIMKYGMMSEILDFSKNIDFNA